MRTRRQITQSCGTAFAETPDPLGGRLSAQLELGRGLAQAEFPLQHSFCHLLSTVNSQSSMMMVVHSVSWFAFASQHQLPSSRPDGQQPIETSHLESVWQLPYSSGHDFSRAVKSAESMRLQPLRPPFSGCHTDSPAPGALVAAHAFNPRALLRHPTVLRVSRHPSSNLRPVLRTSYAVI